MPLLYTKQGHTGIRDARAVPGARNCWGQDDAEALIRHPDRGGGGRRRPLRHLRPAMRRAALSRLAPTSVFRRPRLQHPLWPRPSSSASAARAISSSNLVSDFPKPVIAAVNGYAIGNGRIITFCCYLIAASYRAEWRLPQVALGILPGHRRARRGSPA